jgi:hypothetical protein
VPSSIPTHFLTVYELPKWAIKDIDRFRRSFLWRGEDPDGVQGGHCLVNWATCMRPRKWGRLGIKDLEKFGWALRLRWLRYSWDTVERPWKNLFKPRDKAIKELFYASTVITVGNGKLTPSGRRAGSTGCLRKSWLPTFSSRRVSNIVQFIKCSTGSIGLRTLSTLIQRNCWMSSFSCFTR